MIKEEPLRDLDFFRILKLVENFSNSEATNRLIRKISPLKSPEDVKEALEEFSELKQFFEAGGELSISTFPDLSELLIRASKEGTFFDASDLKEILKFLRVLDRLSTSLNDLLNYKSLANKIREILGASLTIGQSFFLEKLEAIVDEDGNILDSASSMLKYLRRQINITEEKIKDRLEEILNRRDLSPFLQDRFITKRNDRWVIPVRMDSKGQVKGKLQDVSRSGETAFIEPEEISHLSKKLEDLKIEEKLEEIRILKEISQEIYKISDMLSKEFNFLCYIDKLCSIYKFAQKFKATAPGINWEGRIELIDAIHPILSITKERVEPLNLRLKGKKILVITGPNAGGKTVTLKTIGLLSVMAMAGLPIPASPSSSIPFFKSLFVDLYHEGSIDEQLSSFASQIVKLKEIVENADQDSLVLLDEIGTNTDPEEGSALACAVLEELKKLGSLTFATTHLSKVKIFAATQEGMEIAAMLFDEKTMTPLYRLKIGSLTTSYAFEVAKKYGFPERLIDRANAFKGIVDKRIYELINNLEQTNEEQRKKLEEIEDIKIALLKEKERIEKESSKIEEKRKRILEEAREEANRMLLKLKKDINLLYEEAKRADRRKLKEISKRAAEIIVFEPSEAKQIEEIRVGDFVKLRKLNLSGKVLSIEEDRVRVKTDSIQIEANREDIEKISSGEDTRKIISSGYEFFSNEKREDIYSRKLDIRGIRVNDAIPLIERYLNELSLNEASFGVIIHGIGKGILRESIRDYLKDHPIVKSFRKGNADEGGDAVTLVEIK